MADFAFEIGEQFLVEGVYYQVTARNEIVGNKQVAYTIISVEHLTGESTPSDTAPAAQPEEPETLLPR